MPFFPDPNDVPAELRARPQWVVWKYETREGDDKPTKMPYQPNAPKRKASSNAPRTWASFEAAMRTGPKHGFDGVGYVLSADDPYCGFDLDKCLSPEGTPNSGIRPWLDLLQTYAEVSPSGSGIKGIAIGALPGKGINAGSVEIYDQGRFFTITGRKLAGFPGTPQVLNGAIDKLYTHAQQLKELRDREREAKRQQAYADAALQAEAGKVRHAAEGDRNSTLNSSAWNLARWIRTGLLTEDQILNALMDAAQGAGLGRAEVQATLRSGIRAGQNEDPRKVPPPRATESESSSPSIVTREIAPSVYEDGRPQIDITTIDLPTLMPHVWGALHRQNTPPTLFWRAQELVRLEITEQGALVIKPMDERRMLGHLARAAWWIRRKRKGDDVIITPTVPPNAVVDDCMVNIDTQMPVLTRIVTAPTLSADGTILSEPGYHPSAQLYYDPRMGIDLPSIADVPSKEDMEWARTLLDDFLYDFPFVGEADRCHAIALYLLPFVREMIDGPTPLHLVEAPTMGSGKGLLAETLLMPALGDPPSPVTEAPSDEEWRKLITSQLLMAPPVFYIDNLNRILDSGSLAAALTGREFSNRILGKSEQVSLPIRCIWMAAANNPALSTEISRRCIRIRIDPRVDKPWERTKFRHPKLRSWVREYRADLVAAALTLCRYGLTHGAPGRTLSSYESWSDVMGRILNGCGIPGFLSNLDALYDRADSEGAAWRALIAAWWQAHQFEPQTAGDLYPLVADAEADTLISGKDEIGRKKSFGKALAKIQDRVFSVEVSGTQHRLQVSEAGARHKVKLWTLMPIDE